MANCLSVWNNIRPELVGMLEHHRKAREQEAFELKWRNRLHQLWVLYTTFLQKDRNIDLRKRTLPGWGDAVRLHCMRALLTAQEPQVDITPNEFAAIESEIFARGEEYKTRVGEELAHLLREKASVVSQPSNSTAKGRGKEILPPADNAFEEDLEALLDRPTALFRYDCAHAFSWAGLLEHWQQTLAYQSFSVWRVTVCECAATMERLLETLRLPDTARLSEIEALAASGEPVCTCGAGWQVYNGNTIKPAAKHYYRVHRLVRFTSNLFSPSD